MLSNYRPLFGIFAIDFNPFNQIWSFRKDRFSWAFNNANAAINASFRINHQHIFAFVKAINWADRNTISVFTTYTIIGYDVCHNFKKYSSSLDDKSVQGSHEFKLLRSSAFQAKDDDLLESFLLRISVFTRSKERKTK